ncbi:hypothetical protein MZO42_19945 [Sphingomonas psychrotolerans]|uniref:Uncharacterized protein n=1 Tax=Sphingomonas psychrotolerans TaxID=1327635 RepID=A0ABU3N8Z1_9SPHN|nr:hypothetical protein [Sphingomonas psychrotolerans]MDT8760978.1 hypothetical protein [Sphingomonas psychrotolerans]
MFLPMLFATASISCPEQRAVIEQSTRAALLEAARAPATKELGKAPEFRVDRLEREGDWAFLLATMQGPDGQPFDYRETPLAEAAQQGFVSRTYAALLRRGAGGWEVVAKAIGPSDVAWEGWSKQYGAPAALFRQ